MTDEPAVDFMIGLHLNNNYSVGQVISRNGVTHAGSDPFYLDIMELEVMLRNRILLKTL